MYHLSLTLETPAANVACDEALLDAAETGRFTGEVLRIWESPAPAVVLGRSSPASESQREACAADGVPVLRRASGGGAVVVGSGCLMYAVVLDRRRPEYATVDAVHRAARDRLLAAVAPLEPTAAAAGTSDLAFLPAGHAALRKFSGNSLRVRRRALLYHGTLLYDFDLSTVGRWLGPPTREPAYRRGRTHEMFLANLPVAAAALVAGLRAAWQADEPLPALVAREAAFAAMRRAPTLVE